MKFLWDDSFWKVTIDWSKPMIYEDLINRGSSYDDSAHLYLISGKYSDNAHKVFYVGKTYYQIVSNRLKQQDHKQRYEALKKDYPRHTLYVSHGNIEVVGGNRTAKRIDDIERILIYSMPVEHTVNKQNFFRMV